MSGHVGLHPRGDRALNGYDEIVVALGQFGSAYKDGAAKNSCLIEVIDGLSLGSQVLQEEDTPIQYLSTVR